MPDLLIIQLPYLQILKPQQTCWGFILPCSENLYYAKSICYDRCGKNIKLSKPSALEHSEYLR